MVRLATGISGLDKLIEGGLSQNQIYTISGPPGSGRTTFGIQFLIEGAKINEKGLFVASLDNPTTIIKNMSRFNFNLVNYIKEKKIYFLDAGLEIFEYGPKSTTQPQEEIFDLSSQKSTPKSVLDKIESIIKKIGITRLVIDSSANLPYFIRSKNPDDKQVAQVLIALKQLGVTSLILSEQLQQNTFGIEHYMVNGVFLLQNNIINNSKNQQMVPSSGSDTPVECHRAIQILKFRGTKHDIIPHPLSFSDSGLVVK